MAKSTITVSLGSGADDPATSGKISVRRVREGVDGDMLVLSAWKDYSVTEGLQLEVTVGELYESRELEPRGRTRYWYAPAATTPYADLEDVYPLPPGEDYGPQGVGVVDAVQLEPGQVSFNLTDGSTTTPIDLPQGEPGPNSIPTDEFMASTADDPTSEFAASLAAKIVSGQGKATAPLSRLAVPRTGLAPTFVKSPDNPLFMKDDTTAATITWCWVMRVDGYLATPRAAWYMWFSTDHSSSDGGVWLAYADNPAGPWTQVGQVYVGATGSQIETPSVVWDPTISKFRMIMHRKSAGLSGAIADQVSVAATSADGETNWSALTIVLDDTTNAWPGGDHYGYLRPFWANGRLAAYHVIGGGDNSHYGISYSDDYGATWTTDPRPLGYGAEGIPDPAQRVDWIQCGVIDWRGQPWYVGAMRPPTSGGEIVQSTWIAAPLSPDLRRFAAKAIDITPPAQAWENTVLGSPLSVVSDGGRMYLFYRGSGGLGGFGVAVSEVAA